MTDEIDDLVRAAAKAHEALGARDHFDGFSGRVMARISAGETYGPLPDAREVAMMSEADDPISAKSSAAGATPPPRSEDSGLHDVKSLAQTTKQRISRRITSQHDAYDESLLNSSTSGLRAVALPAPAQVVSLPDLPGAAGAADVASSGAAVTPIGAARGKSKTVWFVAGAGVLAAAAAAVFIVAGGGSKKSDQQYAAAGSGSAIALEQDRLAPSAGERAAMGSGSGAPSGIAAGSGATSVVALDQGAAAPPDDSAPKADRKPADKAETARAGGGGGTAGADTGGKAGGEKGGGKKAGEDKGKPGGGGGGGGGAGGGSGSAKAGGGDSIEDLLNEASGGAQKPTEGGGGGGSAAAPEKTGLDGKDIRSGMSAVAKTAQGCFDQHGVAGHVKVKAVVDPSGKVTKADATGEFAGTPTGSCVAAAAKGASFPSWTGAPMTISYGFTLIE